MGHPLGIVIRRLKNNAYRTGGSATLAAGSLYLGY